MASMFPLSDIVDRAGELHAKRSAVRQGSTQLSYGELIRRAVALAGGLLAHGLNPGDRVAIFGRNSFRYLEVNLACAYAGLVLVPLNIRLAAREIDRILTQTETRLVLQALPYESPGIAAITWDDDQPPGADNAYEQLVGSSTALALPVARKLDDVTQIFFTSGTTGEPKGACLTQQNLVASALDAIITLDLSEDDVWFHAPPMFHLVDAFAIWAMTLTGGCHVTEPFDPARFGPVVESTRVTKVSLPPTLLDMIVRNSPIAKYDLRSLNRVSFGGSPMPEPIYQRCTTALGCPLVQSYGATETSGTVCQQFPRDVIGKPWSNSIGQPVPHIRLRVVDDDGVPLPPGAIGELAVAGPRLMAGYWRNPAATAAAIPDGWYRTGDLGTRDHAGHFTILGRKKDMIISGGENVYPAEVESVLLCHRAVAEAAVFGVPSERWGEEVRAVVVLNDGEKITSAELVEHCREAIGGYKVPKVIDISAEPLPKTGPGKIAKTLLRETYWKRAS